MNGRFKAASVHAVMAFLLCLGLLLPSLGVLGMMHRAPAAVAVAAVLTAVFVCSGLERTAGLAARLLFLLGVIGWLAFGGAREAVQCARAVGLAAFGQPDALPMFDQSLSLMLAVIFAPLCCVLTREKLGAAPAVMIAALCGFMLWITAREDLILWLLPAAATALVLAALRNGEGISPRRIVLYALALIFVSYIVTPSGGATVPALKDAADRARQTILDYLFYTEPRSVFSLSAEGYYPQGLGQLGGPAEPTDHSVMMVSTPRRVYLRGAIKDLYTGRTWLDSIGGRRYLWVSPRWRQVRSDTFDEELPGGALGQETGPMREGTVRIHMVESSASTMFVPQRVRDLRTGGDLVPYFNGGSEIFATRDLEPGDIWTADAPLMIAGDAGLATLVAACETNQDDAYARIARAYTGLPEHLQQSVYDLAREITAGLTSPYEQALALRNYLSRTYRYTLEPPEQSPEHDFVTSFLFRTKEGYCTYFASAMTVLCRTLGIPARYIEGYLAEPGANGVARVTGLDGHAWTEVYLRGFGWLTFDATPSGRAGGSGSEENNGGNAPTPTPEPEQTPEPGEEDSNESETENETPTPEPEQTPTPEPMEQPGQTPEPDPEEAPGNNNNIKSLSWLWLILLILALALRIWQTQPGEALRRAKDGPARWQVALQALYDALCVTGGPRSPNESPNAYFERCAGFAGNSEKLREIGECVSVVCYGHAEPLPDETTMIMDAYGAAAKKLSRRGKVRLALRRAFVPKSRRSFFDLKTKAGK